MVVDRSAEPGKLANPRPLAVHYAQHNSVVRYSWRRLRDRWDELSEYTKEVNGAAERPLVFSARGTHASYPTPCFKKECDQTAGDEEEKRHNGLLPWAGNFAAGCGEGSACLASLPTLIGGSRPALWNAFNWALGQDPLHPQVVLQPAP